MEKRRIIENLTAILETVKRSTSPQYFNLKRISIYIASLNIAIYYVYPKIEYDKQYIIY